MAIPVIIDAKIKDHKEISAWTVYCYGNIVDGSGKHDPYYCPACGEAVPTQGAIMVLEGLDDSEPDCHHADAVSPKQYPTPEHSEDEEPPF